MIKKTISLIIALLILQTVMPAGFAMATERGTSSVSRSSTAPVARSTTPTPVVSPIVNTPVISRENSLDRAVVRSLTSPFPGSNSSVNDGRPEPITPPTRGGGIEPPPQDPGTDVYCGGELPDVYISDYTKTGVIYADPSSEYDYLTFDVTIGIAQADLYFINNDHRSFQLGATDSYDALKKIFWVKNPVVSLSGYSLLTPFDDVLYRVSEYETDVESGKKFLPCGTTYTFTDVKVPVNKAASYSGITFIADFYNKYQEVDEINLTSGSLFTNNIREYSHQNYSAATMIEQVIVDEKNKTLSVTLVYYGGEPVTVRHLENFQPAWKKPRAFNKNSYHNIINTEGKYIDGDLFQSISYLPPKYVPQIEPLREFISVEGKNYVTYTNLPITNHTWVLYSQDGQQSIALDLIVPPTLPKYLCELTECNIPSNHIRVTRKTPQIQDISPASISLNPQTAVVYEACVFGSKSADIESIAFKTATDASMKINVFKNSLALWPYPIAVESYWPGDFPFEKKVTVPANTCVQFSVDILELEAGKDGTTGNYARFDMKGMAASLPVYFKPDNQVGWKNLATSEENVTGTYDIFSYRSAVMMPLFGNPTNLTETYVVGKQVFVGVAEVRSLPYTKATLEGLTLHTSSTFSIELPFEVDVYEYNEFDSTLLTKINTVVPAHTGEIVLPLDYDMVFGKNLQFIFRMPTGAPSKGEIQFYLEALSGAETVYKAQLLQYMGGNFNEFTFPSLILHAKFIDEIENISVAKFSFSPLLGSGGTQTLYYTPKMQEQELTSAGGTLLSSLHISVPNTQKEFVVEDFNVVFSGTFSNAPVKILLKNHWSEVVGTIDGTIFPGKEIVIPQMTVGPYASMRVEIYMSGVISTSYPVFITTELPGITVKDKMGNAIDTVFTGYNAPASFPAKSHPVFFGPAKLFEASNGNSNSPEYVFLDLIPEGEDEFVMNQVCFKTQGPVQIKSMTYHHFLHDDSTKAPFQEAILDTGSNKIYMQDSQWTQKQILAKFPFTKPISLGSQQTFCAVMKVRTPQFDIDNAFFDLIGIEAETPVGEPVLTYLKNSNAELSKQYPIKGTVYSFVK